MSWLAGTYVVRGGAGIKGKPVGGSASGSASILLGVALGPVADGGFDAETPVGLASLLPLPLEDDRTLLEGKRLRGDPLLGGWCM
jgi:hypothetical protein